jgi:hypothetical protein
MVAMNKSDNQAQHIENNKDDDEISLSELVATISKWVQRNYRGLRLIALSLAAIVILSTAAFALRSPPMMTYSMILSLAFPQAEKDRYPNQAPFGITDIVTRSVLEEVWEQNDLEKQNISLSDLIKSVSIVQYADNAQFIRTKYQAMLGRKGLSQTDISVLERDYTAELESASKKEVLLSLTVPFSSPLSGALAKKVLSDIPRVWSHQAINKLGVTSIPNMESDQLNENNFNRYTPFQMVDYFYKSADNLEKSIIAIENFPGGKTLRDTQTGRTVEDLKKRLIEILRYWILDFDNYVQVNFRPNEIERLSSEIQLKELTVRKNEFLSQANIYRNSLTDYDALKQQKDSLGFRLNDQRNGQSNSLQLQGDTLQRLMNLGSQNKDAEFRQELTLKRVEAEINATKMDMEISRLTRRINTLTISAPKSATSLEQVNVYSQDIMKQMQAVSNSIKRIQQVQMNKFMADDGLLYIGSNITERPASNVSRWVAIPGVLLIMIFAVWLLLSGLKRYASTPRHVLN